MPPTSICKEVHLSSRFTQMKYVYSLTHLSLRAEFCNFKNKIILLPITIFNEK